MATKRLQFFMMPEEFFDVVNNELAPSELEVIDAAKGTWGPVQVDASHRHVFIAPRGTDRPSPELVRPGREGWLVVTPPSVEGKRLYMAEIAAKSDWNDPETNETRRNPDVERLFGWVARRFRQKLEFPVVASNEVTSKSNIYKTIGYSEGALRWLEDSGEWRQEGLATSGSDFDSVKVTQ